MTLPRHNRASTPLAALEWVLIAIVILWFTGIPLVVAISAEIIEPVQGNWIRPARIVLTGVFLFGGTLVAVAIAKLGPNWQRLFAVSIILSFATIWLTFSGLVRALLPAAPFWATLLQLVVGIPFLLIAGGWAIARIGGQDLFSAWQQMGIFRTGSLAWGLAASALVLWPWFLVGSLGDLYASIALVFQALGGILLTEMLWRGLGLGLLLSSSRRRWEAALLGTILYLAYEQVLVFAANDWNGLLRPLLLLPLILLITELWARPGPNRQGIWGAASFHFLYAVIPALFVDPRASEELTHSYAQHYAFAGAAIIAIFMFTQRKIWPNLFKRHAGPSRLRSVLIAVIPWSLVLTACAFFGSPGFSNDGYLIILSEQADLSAADDIPSREGRLVYVHTLLRETATLSQSSIRAELDEMNLSYRPYYLVNMIRIDGSTRGMDSFAQRPDVAQVIRNPNMREYPFALPDPYLGIRAEITELPWGLDAIDAEEIWELGITGQNIVVASQDSGFDWEHPALKDSYRGWNGTTANHDFNWHDAWDDSPIPFDDDNHGTHTLGTVVGNDVGMAPDASWIGCRNMRHGIGNPGSYVECMEFFLAPYAIGGDPFSDGDPLLAPHVINNSWGCPAEEGCISPEPIHTAVEALRAAGIMMVASVGNEGPACGTIWLPASEDAVFTVAASNEQGHITYFSSRGPTDDGLTKPDVTAPGVNITSSIPGHEYATSAGTSMASPHVTGLVALLWSGFPDLIGQIDLTEQIITSSAGHEPANNLCPAGEETCTCYPDAVDEIPNNIYGYGIIDAKAAIDAALAQTNLHLPNQTFPGE